VLVPRGRRRPPLVLPARSVRRPDVTAASGQERYSYDWSGFSADISTRLLRAGRRWLTGTWDCYVLVRGRGVWRPARLNVAGPPPADPGAREIAPGLRLGAAWTGGRLELRLRQDQAPRPAPTGQSWRPDGTLVLRGRLPEDAAGGCEVVLRQLDGWDTRVVRAAAAASAPPSRSAWRMAAFGDPAAASRGRVGDHAPRPADRSIRARGRGQPPGQDRPQDLPPRERRQRRRDPAAVGHRRSARD
jgi:hypothetical protein